MNPMPEALTPVKINRRTLKKRIRRTIFFSSFINIVIFAIIVLIVTSVIFKPIAHLSSGFIGSTIANDMNSKAFLLNQEIDSLTSFNPNSTQGAIWKDTMARMANLQYFIPKETYNKLTEDPEVSSFILDSNFNFVNIHVVLEGKEIYTNQENMLQRMGGGINKLLRFYTVESTFPLLDEEGQPVGEVTAAIDPQVTVFLFMSVAFIFLALVLVALCITALISKLLTIPIITPLNQLTAKFRAIAQEGTDASSLSQITLQRPLREVESLLDSTNMILHRMGGYNELLQNQKQILEEQNEELEAQNEELTETKLIIQEAQAKLYHSGRSVRNLLDNAGQGFLTFGADLLIDQEYSLECKHIFDREIYNEPYPALIRSFCGDDEQLVFLNNIMGRIFMEQDSGKRSIYLSLLPDEMAVRQRQIHFSYKMIHDPVNSQETLMVIMTDITEKRNLQNQMENERNILKMVVKVVVNYGDFRECERDFKNFYEVGLQDILTRGDSSRAMLMDIYRELHTYKGNFAQFGLLHIIHTLHDAETKLADWIKKADSLSLNDLVQMLKELRIPAWLQEDMSTLKSILGEAFFNQEDSVLVDKSKIMEIEKKMLTILSPNECKLLLPDLRKLRYKPFTELLKSYPEYVMGLAERTEKFIHPFEIEGEEVLTDTDKYYDLSRSLVHIFRNIVDHAIEPLEERVAAGKDEYARIVCKVSLVQDQIRIAISDDGRGILWTDIRDKAAAKGMVDPDKALTMSERDWIRLIFSEEFSTKDQVTELSGRGMGLSSVLSEVHKLEGRIEVVTEAGKGTEFLFTLPYQEVTGLPQLELSLMIQPLIEKTKDYFARFVKITVTSETDFTRNPTDKISLKKVTSFVSLKGAIEGMFVMTIDEELSHTMVRNIAIDPLSPEEISEYTEDNLAETANIILGNSIRMFEDLQDYILMEPPITLFTAGAAIKYSDAEIWTCRMNAAEGEMLISFVMMKKGR